jgi:hypothetical protein
VTLILLVPFHVGYGFLRGILIVRVKKIVASEISWQTRQCGIFQLESVALTYPDKERFK